MPSQWATARGLGDLEDKISWGVPLSQPEMTLLEGGGVPVGSSIPISGWSPDTAAGNQSAIWSDFVARVQDRESSNDWGFLSGFNSIGEALGKLVKGAAATAGFGVGATTGAAIATGKTDSDTIKKTVVADAAGLAAGAGIAGYGLGATTSAIVKGASAVASIKSRLDARKKKASAAAPHPFFFLRAVRPCL